MGLLYRVDTSLVMLDMIGLVARIHADPTTAIASCISRFNKVQAKIAIVKLSIEQLLQLQWSVFGFRSHLQIFLFVRHLLQSSTLTIRVL